MTTLTQGSFGTGGLGGVGLDANSGLPGTNGLSCGLLDFSGAGEVCAD
jgi:hypothetical protein